MKRTSKSVGASASKPQPQPPLVPVTWRVVAGPPGAPTFMSSKESAASLKRLGLG